MADGKVLKITV